MKPGATAMVGAALLMLPTSASMAADNLPAPVLSQPCAACHLPSGAGVPGAFPPLRDNLRALADTPAGRRYVVLAVIRGLTGPLVVGSQRFNGAMPAQPLGNDQVARILNDLLGPGQRAFTSREVAGIRTAGAMLNGAQVARLRPAPAGR